MTLTEDRETVRYNRPRRAWHGINNPRWTRSAWISLAFLGCVLIAGLAVGLSGGGSSHPTAIPGMFGRPQPTNQDQSIPVVAPNVPWIVVGGAEPNGMAVPDGGLRYGPVNRDPTRNLYSDYSHDPSGALIAMLDISVRAQVGDQWRATAETQLTGPSRDSYLALRATQPNTPPADGWDSYIAYRFISYDPMNASIQIAAVSSRTGEMHAIAESVQWVDGDWRLSLLSNGDASSSFETISSLEGYTIFGEGSNAQTGRD